MYEEYWEKEEPIKEIHCTKTDCENDLHCFRPKRKKRGESYRNVTCYQCDADIIDWERMDQMDLNDKNYTFSALKNEWIRNLYWYRKIDEKITIKAQKKGLDDLRVWTAKQLDKKLVPHYKDIFRNGMQTPYEGNIIYYAQHATATCCRNCLQEWYNIERDRPLTNEETEYFLELIMLYTEERLPKISQ